MSQPKKRRSDAGKLNPTARDIALLHLMGEQYCLSLDHLIHLGALHSPRADIAASGELSRNAATKLYLRWHKAGLIAYQRSSEMLFFWLTTAGLRLVGLPYKQWEPALIQRDHYRAVTAVRLQLEHAYGRRGQPLEWESERAIRAQGKEAGVHIPDGAVWTADGHIAIEVELTRKKYRDHQEIFTSLLRQYDYIWYYVDNPVYTNVVTNLTRYFDDAYLGSYQKRFNVLRLEEHLDGRFYSGLLRDTVH